jgi:hypothetical protein
MYFIKDFLNEDLMCVLNDKYGKQLWAVSKLTCKHKNDKCAVCGEPVGDIAFRPITNASNRMHRICTRHRSNFYRKKITKK